MIRAAGIALLLIATPRLARAEDVCHAIAGAPVERIEVYGLSDVKAAVVEDAVKLRPGMIVPPLALAKFEDAILATGWFASARVVIVGEADDCVLRVRVEEYPPIAEVHFDGATAYDGGRELAGSLASKPGARANRIAAAKDATAIADRYHDDGYEAARVAGVDIADGIVTFRIREGRIAKVDVVGARRTGTARVKEILGIRPGQIYNAVSLISGQAALYRTGLFSNVGFGVETPRGAEGDDADGITLTVTVGELIAPFSRTEMFVDRGQTVISIEARMRNLTKGHSANARAEVVGASTAELADVGFDEFYRLHGEGEIHFFRPNETAAGAFLGVDAERVHGRRRPELGLLLNVDTPAGRAGVEIPAIASADWEGIGSFAGVAGVRSIRTYDPLGTAVGKPLREVIAGYGRGELGFDLRRISGVETPARARLRTGVEWNGGLRPFSWIEGDAGGRIVIWHGLKFEGALDGASITGESIPAWREYALDGAKGPLGFPREYAFTKSFARGGGDLTLSAVHGLAGIAAGGGAAIWARPRSATVDNAESVHLELRAGPPFARVRAGVAAPLPGARAGDLWWYLAVSIGTPQ